MRAREGTPVTPGPCTPADTLGKARSGRSGDAMQAHQAEFEPVTSADPSKDPTTERTSMCTPSPTHAASDGTMPTPTSGSCDPSREDAIPTSKSDESKMAIKIVLNQNVRRFTLSHNSSFTELVEQVHARFGLTGSVHLLYKDDESEMCTIGCDDELLEAMRLAALAAPPVLRIQVEVDVEVPRAKALAETAAAAADPKPSVTQDNAALASRNGAHHTGDTEVNCARQTIAEPERPSPASRVLSRVCLQMPTLPKRQRK